MNIDPANIDNPNMAASKSFRPTLLNMAYLEEISGSNDGFIEDVLTMFRDESNEFLAKIRSNFAQRDFYSLRKLSHAMKPTGSYIGVNSLTSLVASLEKACPSGDANVVGGMIVEVEKMLTLLNSEIDAYFAATRQ